MNRSILVNANQKGNPLLNCITAHPWEYSDIVPDYLVGQSNCVLFLSLKYHRLHPEYIQTRLSNVKLFKVRILLVLVDITAHQQSVREVSKLAFDANISLILAFSTEDTAKYIETLKSYEHKSPDFIREKIDSNNFGKLSACLTKIRSVNKTDVITLTSNFKVPIINRLLKNCCNATKPNFDSYPDSGTKR